MMFTTDHLAGLALALCLATGCASTPAPTPRAPTSGSLAHEVATVFPTAPIAEPDPLPESASFVPALEAQLGEMRMHDAIQYFGRPDTVGTTPEGDWWQWNNPADHKGVLFGPMSKLLLRFDSTGRLRAYRTYTP